MSTEQPLDPQLIEQTKQQIRSLVAEIAQLSKSEISPEEFYGQFLTRLVSALAAVGGVVWTTNEDGRLALQYQINLQETRLREREEDQLQHSRLLYKVLSGGEGLLMPPHCGAGDDQQAGNPTDFLLVLGPLKTDLETVGLVEIFQRGDATPSAQKGYLRFLMQMCELAVDFLKSHQLRHFSHRQVLWTQLEDFSRVVHASLDPRETAYTIANEGRRLIDCDRLSVAIRKGKHCKIEAISGQDVFDKRSNVVRLLGKLATAVTATGEAVWYSGDTRDLAPQVEKAVEAYVDEAHSKTVAILPLKRPAPPDEQDDPAKRGEPHAPIGALVVEQIEDSRVPASMIQRVEVVSRHSATALANALEHQNLFLMPLWRALGKTRWVLQARTLPKTLSISGAILLVVLILALWPARFEMESKGTLEPVDRRDIFAPNDGRVEELKVDHADSVQVDQLLVQLRNTDLETQIDQAVGDFSSTTERINYLQRAWVEESKIRPEERIQLAGELAEMQEKQASLEKQLALLKYKRAELSIKSPINGQVVTWDLRNRLISRPVQRGQVLMRVADPSGPWQLELHMPENHMGHVAQALQAIYDRSREELRKLLNEQIRAKLPEATAEEIAHAVQEELAKVPDENLYAKQIALLNERLHGQLSEIIKGLPDGELKDKLAQALREESFDEARAKLKELLPEAADAELSDRLAALPLEKPENEQLQVSYILATEPGKTRTGTVKEVQRSAEVRGDEGNTVLIKVAIDKQELPDLRPGATVTAKVYCGRRPLGYVLLHDLIAFIQSRIIFRYF